MLVQRGLEAAGLTVVVRSEDDRLVRFRLGFPGFASLIPHPQQDVLDPRQLVLGRAQRVQQVRHDLWLDPAADRRDGPLDDVLDLLTGHAGRKELGLGDGGRQPQKRLAFAEVFRAHGQHDIHVRVTFRCGGKQHIDEREGGVAPIGWGIAVIGLAGAAAFQKAENLLELIDQYDQSRRLRQQRVGDHFHQTARAAAERLAAELDEFRIE